MEMIMAKNILIFNGSPRPRGNTERLADALAEGARAAGNSVTQLNLREMDIRYCKGCYACFYGKGSPCIQKDDMRTIYAAYTTADSVVLASPLYFWTFSAQLKTAIDRLLAAHVKEGNLVSVPKESALIAAAGDADEHVYDHLTRYYHDVLVPNLRWTDRGMVLATGVSAPGDVTGTAFIGAARELGASL